MYHCVSVYRIYEKNLTKATPLERPLFWYKRDDLTTGVPL